MPFSRDAFHLSMSGIDRLVAAYGETIRRVLR